MDVPTLTPDSLLGYLVARINGAAKEARTLLVSVATVAAYVIVASFMEASGEITLPILGNRVDRGHFANASAVLLLIVYAAQQAFYQDLMDSIERFKRFTGNIDGPQPSWEPTLPADRILNPSLVVFASFGDNVLLKLGSATVNRFLGPVALWSLLYPSGWRVGIAGPAALASVVALYYLWRTQRLKT